MSYLVTAAAGKTGSAVVARLRAEGHPVRAVVRRQDARSAALGRSGAEVVVADLHDTAAMTAALTGVRSAFFVPPFIAHATMAAASFAAAAEDARLPAVVQLSQWLAQPSHPSVMTRESWLIERMFACLPETVHVIVNPGMFADNFLRIMDFPALLGIYPNLTGTSQSAPVATEDIARVVAALMLSPAAHRGRQYRPTGPELLSGQDMAHLVGRVLGRKVRPLPVSYGLFRKVARVWGVDMDEVLNLRDYLADHAAGAFSFDGGVTDVVVRLTGTPAEPFETTARRYAALPFAQPTLQNRLRALARFGLVPFVPGLDVDRYARERGFPVPAAPRLSAEDAGWRAARAAQTGQQADVAA